LSMGGAFWLAHNRTEERINRVGLWRRAEQDQNNAQNAQLNALGLRVADLEQRADSDKRRPAPISQAEFTTARQALDDRMTRLEDAHEARAMAVGLQTLFVNQKAADEVRDAGVILC
ncbi:hypothetical protein JTL80_34550, partial [Pseudomonas aeruginosa]|nr:hypothetical protein [Pseudomonas aeruginosa]